MLLIVEVSRHGVSYTCRMAYANIGLGNHRRSRSLSGRIREIDEQDAEMHIADDVDAERGLGALHHIRSRTRSRTDQVVIGWEEDDAENPHNWSTVSNTTPYAEDGAT